MKGLLFLLLALGVSALAQTPAPKPATPPAVPPASPLAPELAPELAPLAAKHKADLAVLGTQQKATIARAQHDYLTALENADRGAIARGDLKGVASIEKEHDLAKTKPDLPLSFPADLPEALRPARKAYLDAIASASADTQKRGQQIDSDYLRTLAIVGTRAAAKPALAQQIAAEKAEIIRKASGAAASTAAVPEKPASPPAGGKPGAPPEPALGAKLVNGNFEEVEANGLPTGWKLYGNLDKGGVLRDGGSIKAMKEAGISFLRMTFDGRFHACGIVQEVAVPNRASTATFKVRYRGKVTGRLNQNWPGNGLTFLNEKGGDVGHHSMSIETEILHKPSTVQTHNEASFKSWEKTVPVGSGAVKARFSLGNGYCNGVFGFEHAEVTFK